MAQESPELGQPMTARRVKYAGTSRPASLPDDVTMVRGPETVAGVVRERVPETDMREHFVALYLNSRNAVLLVHTVSVGSLNASIVHPREVFAPAVRESAASVILAHNHPSGDPTPSAEDRAITDRLRDAGRILGIDVLDHVVIGARGSFVSMRADKVGSW